MCASPFEILTTLCTQLNEQLSDIIPTDREGFWLSPNGINAQQLADTLKDPLEQAGWLITSIKNTTLLIEPRETRRYGGDNQFMFHVTDKANRGKIGREGLNPRGGGNTTMNRQYPDRVFLAVDLFAALEFVQFQCADKKRKELPTNQFQKMFPNAKVRPDLDVWRVHLPERIQLHRDVLFPDKAVWTPNSIPKTNVRRVRSWMIAERVYRFLRKRGFV